MKKLLILLALAASASAMASAKTARLTDIRSASSAAEAGEARACSVLLRNEEDDPFARCGYLAQPVAGMVVHAIGRSGHGQVHGGPPMTIPFAELRGKTVLVVESEFLLPSSIYRAMERIGAELIGPVGLLDDALLLVRDNRPDAAIVDGRLERCDREAVCRMLRREGIPFAEVLLAPPCAEEGTTGPLEPARRLSALVAAFAA